MSLYEVAQLCLSGAWHWALWVYRVLIIIPLGIAAQQQPGEPETEPETRATTGTGLLGSAKMNEDVVDAPMNSEVSQALGKVSGAIYKLCFSEWHRPPESMEEQPLYKELHSAIEAIFSSIRGKARPLQEYEILITATNALTAHLKNVRKKRVIYSYNSEKEEVDFLRSQTEHLLSFWLPDSMRNSLVMVVLKEIISVNVLKPSIDNISDFKVINEIIVRNLGNEGQEKSAGDNVAPLSCSSLEASSPCLESDSFHPSSQPEPENIRRSGGVRKMISSKKKAIKQMMTFKGSKKPPKHKEQEEDETEFRSLCMAEEEEGKEEETVDYVQSGWNGDENDLTSICDIVLQKLSQEDWTAYCENTTDKSFKIHVSNPLNTELWVTERSAQNFRQIYERLSKKYQVFNQFNENQDTTSFFQAIDTTPDSFVKILETLIKDKQDPEAIFFLTPFNYEEESEALFTATLPDSEEDLTFDDDQESDESREEDGSEESDDSAGCLESDGFKCLKKKEKNDKKNKKDSNCQLETPSRELNPVQAAASSDPSLSGIEAASGDEVGIKINYKLQKAPYKRAKEQKTRKQELEDSLINAVLILCNKLLAGGTKNFFQFLYSIGSLNGIIKPLLDTIPQLCAEDHIVWYLDRTAEMLLSKVDPLPYTPEELKSKVQELFKSHLQSFSLNKVVTFLFEKRVLKSITASHEAFQSQKTNKETIYGLLEALTGIIINGATVSKTY